MILDLSTGRSTPWIRHEAKIALDVQAGEPDVSDTEPSEDLPDYGIAWPRRPPIHVRNTRENSRKKSIVTRRCIDSQIHMIVAYT